MTWRRIFELLALHRETHTLELVELGSVVNQAMTKPENLRKLARAAQPAKRVEATGMIKIPRRRG